MFARFIRLGIPYISLDAQGRCRPSLANLFNWKYIGLENLPHTKEEQFVKCNPAFLYTKQLINVDGQESAPRPFFYQNAQEADQIVALFQMMVMHGYPAYKISVLTTYNGQRALLQQKFEAIRNRYGYPKRISTVDKYQGQQNDCMHLLSFSF